jgi:hypothetical protein
MFVEPRYIVAYPSAAPVPKTCPLKLKIAITLLEALVGVIESEKLVVTKDVLVVDVTPDVVVELTTCNTLPAGKLVLVPFVSTVPLVVGNVSVVVPDTAGEDNVTLPDVEPLSIRLAIKLFLIY